MLLIDKLAFITGSNRGIGYSILEKFASEGCNIIAHSRTYNEDFSNKLKSLENKYNITIKNLNFDLLDRELMKAEVYKIFKNKIPIDILVNSAGIIHGGLFQMSPVKDIRKVFDVNFFSLLELTQLISKYMTRFKKGNIINISSVAGLDLSAGNCAYGTSKAAVIAFSKTLSSELNSYGIRVNVVAPSLTNTDMAFSKEASKERESLLNSNKPFERMANPSEISDAVFFLASENSKFINGQVLRVDGGNKF
jgi:3-oxoacyl-[acyl-carrier protein] reductase